MSTTTYFFFSIMIIGIISGLVAAMFNSIGYLVSAQFIQKFKSSFRLLILAQFAMLILSVPFLPWLFPWNNLQEPGQFMLRSIGWVIVFMLGQCSFFTALRYFEASRLSSLLGLKIIVLAVMFMVSQHVLLNGGQGIAVCLAAAAGMLFNWSGATKTDWRGWCLVCVVLVCYSSADLLETSLVVHLQKSGLGIYHSAFATTAFLYTLLGLTALFVLKPCKPTKETMSLAFPYAALWLCSQASLFVCFGSIKPVFGNVILASRGLFSVAIGAALPLIGLASLESKISKRKWLQRAVAATLMAAAVGLYSYASSH